MKQPKRDRSRTRRGCHRGSYREVLGEASTHMLWRSHVVCHVHRKRQIYRESRLVEAGGWSGD